jgi:hypothetical protein
MVSIRRFDLGSETQPILQFIAATLPFFFLLLWFLLEAHLRPKSPCYDNVDDDGAKENQSKACSKLIPLTQFVYVYMATEFCWMLLAVYLTFYVPRRHNLVEAYLTQGETIIGDVYYNRKKRGVAALTSYGKVVYPRPGDSRMIRRKVQVFERYTRERAAILYLPGLPCSGQPKVDLEIDREVIELNRPRMEILFWYSYAWAAFCMLAPIYIIKVLKVLDANYVAVWQPDANLGDFPMWFFISAFAIIPVVAFLWNLAGWLLYKRWMTSQHRVLEEGEPGNEPERGCCFDDEDCESIDAADYVPPSPKVSGAEGTPQVGTV